MPRRQPPVEFAAMGRRWSPEHRTLISSVQRQRLLALQDLESNGVPMTPWERRELLLLERLQGERGPELDASELAELARLQQETTAAQLGVTRSHSGRYESRGRVSGRRRQLDTLAARWPAPRLTTQQKMVELWEMRILADMSPRQRAVWKVRP